MENDDKPTGQLLTRRDALKLLGIGGYMLLASCAAPATTRTLIPTAGTGATQAPSITNTALDCIVRPELTIGPYFVDNQLNRSEIRSEPSDNSVKEGVPLTLSIKEISARLSNYRCKWQSSICYHLPRLVPGKSSAYPLYNSYQGRE